MAPGLVAHSPTPAVGLCAWLGLGCALCAARIGSAVPWPSWGARRCVPNRRRALRSCGGPFSCAFSVTELLLAAVRGPQTANRSRHSKSDSFVQKVVSQYSLYSLYLRASRYTISCILHCHFTPFRAPELQETLSASTVQAVTAILTHPIAIYFHLRQKHRLTCQSHKQVHFL